MKKETLILGIGIIIFLVLLFLYIWLPSQSTDDSALFESQAKRPCFNYTDCKLMQKYSPGHENYSLISVNKHDTQKLNCLESLGYKDYERIGTYPWHNCYQDKCAIDTEHEIVQSPVVEACE